MKSKRKSAQNVPPREGSAAEGKRDRKKELTKDRILAAALELFREKGLEGTTTKEISQRAGIAEGTLFNYFRTKEDLALFFFQKETDDLIAWYQGNTHLAKASLPEKLFAIMHRQLEYLAPSEDFIGAVFFRSLQPHSKLNPLSLESQQLRLRYLMFIRGILAEAEEKGEIPPLGDLGSYGVGLFYLGVVAHWLNDTSEGKQKTLAVLDRVLHGAMRIARKEGWEW
ncbi:MAG TPA: TetR/AcrR family transcriptional regulator [Candidatus Limnocylindria bacterium]|jgi:AcrR family transcriptional regulator|nr:TetR/AcrR family transcriptional regulator [Candidatus Limnocylindria bacterium]